MLNRFKNVVGWEFERPPLKNEHNGEGGDRSLCLPQYGKILTSQKLINNLEFKVGLFERYPEAIGGEMEGEGVYSACARAKVEWIIAKGVCDWADGQKHDGYQELAAAAAASLAHFVFSRPGALNELIPPPHA